MMDKIIPIPFDASTNEWYLKQLELREEIDKMCGIPENILRNYGWLKDQQPGKKGK